MTLFFVVLTDTLSQSAFNLATFVTKKTFAGYRFLVCGLMFLMALHQNYSNRHTDSRRDTVHAPS